MKSESNQLLEAQLRATRPDSGFANGVVMGYSLVVSEPKNNDTISEEAIRDELARILESSMFAQSDRLGRFLRFTVETTLAGEAQRLKEYLDWHRGIRAQAAFD